MSVVFVESDTGPDVLATLYEQNDPSQVINLTGASVKFQMRGANDKHYRVNATCAVINAAGGQVSYAWAPGDLKVPGEYVVQFEITFADATIQTTVTPIPIVVRPE